MSNKILIVTSSDEPNVAKVLQFLTDGSERVLRLDTDIFLSEGKILFSINKHQVEWIVQIESSIVSLSEIKSIWYRRPTASKAPSSFSPNYASFIESEMKKLLFTSWVLMDAKEIFWMNHPLKLHLLEFNKPYQLKTAAAIGLDIPETLITNKPEALMGFFERWNGEVVLKTFGSGLVDKSGQPLAIYTNKITREILEQYKDEISYAPVFCQNYIPKALELRITIVGQRIFTCAIHSQDSEKTKDDWRRYDFDNVKHEQYQLPRKIECKLLKLMNIWQLNFGAIDMILTPEGKYVFLEVNPSGQWGWIENITGMPISKSIAEILADPPE